MFGQSNMEIIMKKFFISACVAAMLASGASAQGKFLTAAEVKPILNATKNSWIAVREYNGKDLLYFTHLLSWRCGLTAIQYGVNSDLATLALPVEACDEEARTPAALSDTQPIYAEFAPKSIYFVTVKIIYDDGTTDQMTYKRKAVEIN